MGTAVLRACRAVAFFLLISVSLPPSSSPAATDKGPYLLHLERGDSIQVVRLEPATFGMFRYVRIDSAEGYLSGHKVRSITDGVGRDLGRDPLERRRSIGVDPLLYRRDGELRRRHRSRREDRTFGIFEAGYYRQIGGPASPYDETLMMTADAGALRSLSRNVAVGGVLHFEVDDDRIGLGVGLRGRRWLNDTFSLDGGAGWMLAGEDDRGDFKPGAFFGEGAINFGDYLQLAARIESWRFARHEYRYGPLDSLGYLSPESQPYTDVTRFPAERETRVHIGAKAGRYPGILLVVALSLLALSFQSAYMY